MTEKVTVGEALVMSLFAVSEECIPHRAIYDMGWIVKNPLEMVVAIDALVQLKEIVDAHYSKEEDTPPPHEVNYFEAGDGDPSWLKYED